MIANETKFENMAEMFKAFSDPTRLMILKLLSENESMCVCNIIDELKNRNQQYLIT